LFQETFDAGLQAFQQEGIANITALKDQLLAAKHVQSKAIEARHAALMKRWSQLLANSATRKKKLLEAQSHFRKVEDLFLTFAKKASAFNSWFENAEEDLTDPVRCNSLEEIRALREAHDAFRSSLSSAQADFSQLAELDRQIKSFRVASNPYTWFTMEALEETWRNLQKIIKERELELQKEQRRQEENDKLRQEFAQHANAFHQWIQETRTYLLDGLILSSCSSGLVVWWCLVCLCTCPLSPCGLACRGPQDGPSCPRRAALPPAHPRPSSVPIALQGVRVLDSP